MLWALRLQARKQVSTGALQREILEPQQSAEYVERYEGDPPVVSPAVPTGSLTLMYRNAGADVAMQRCADSRKASVTDCTTAPLVSARAPLHIRLRLSHWLLERRMLRQSHSNASHSSHADMSMRVYYTLLWQGHLRWEEPDLDAGHCGPLGPPKSMPLTPRKASFSSASLILLDTRDSC